MKINHRHLLAVLIPWALVSGCASNDELFARYDAWCEGTSCLAPQLQTEIVYLRDEAMLWEPAVYFGYDLHDLAEIEQTRIDRNIAVLQKHPDYKISLQAFTDSIASVGYNIALSERRRDSVIRYLGLAGIDESRILSSAAGKMLPVLPGDSADDRIINRRVEMMLLDEAGRPVVFGISLPENPEPFVPPSPTDKVD